MCEVGEVKGGVIGEDRQGKADEREVGEGRDSEWRG